MTLEQLRIFLAVAEGLNMTRAADQLHLSQPAVSAAVAALEARHKTRLFDRVGKRLELTEAGRAFMPEARAVLSQATAAQRVLEDLGGLLRGELRIFASQTVATYWLPPRLAHFAAAYPGVSLPYMVGNTAQAVAAIIAGDADLAFVEGIVDEPRVSRETLGGDALGLYVAPGHALIGRTLSRDHLKAATWVVREAGSGTREHFVKSLDRYGLALSDLNVRLELPSNGAALGAIEAGGLIAAVSDLAAAARCATGQVVRLDCDLPPRSFRAITHRERRLSRAAEAFLQCVRPSMPA